MSDPVPSLLRALRRSAGAAGCRAELAHVDETAWATATFTGARHSVRATGEPHALAGWLAMLPEADLPVRDHFVASCAAELVAGTATIELLVLEE